MLRTNQIQIKESIFNFRIQRLAQTIKEDYGNEPVTLLCVLKGGFRFCQDLMTSISELNRSSGMLIKLEHNIELLVSS